MSSQSSSKFRQDEAHACVVVRLTFAQHHILTHEWEKAAENILRAADHAISKEDVANCRNFYRELGEDHAFDWIRYRQQLTGAQL